LALAAQDETPINCSATPARWPPPANTRKPSRCWRALGVEDAAPDPDHPLLVPILDALGSVQRAQGHHADAQTSYLRALNTLEKSAGDRKRHADSATQAAGRRLRRARSRSRCRAQLLRAISIREKAANRNDLDLAGDCAELGSFYLARSATPWRSRISAAPSAWWSGKLGPEDATLVPLLDNLADVFIKQQNWPPAEPPLRRIVWIQERAVGPSDVKLAPNLDKLALLLFHEERFPEAEALYRRSLAIWEPAMGPPIPT
jgi:tetratricopeptide (TPR) repeat protein